VKTARLAMNPMTRSAGHRPFVRAVIHGGVQQLACASYEDRSASPGAGVV